MTTSHSTRDDASSETDTDTRLFDRRRFIAGSATALTAPHAGCFGGDSGQSGDDGGSGRTGTPTSTDSETTTDTETAVSTTTETAMTTKQSGSVPGQDKWDPEVWICPLLTPAAAESMDAFVGEMGRLFSSDAPWGTVREGIDVFKFYINGIRWFQRRDPDGFERAMEFLADDDVKVAVEAGGFAPGNPPKETGVPAAEAELEVFEAIEDAGGDMHYVSIDNHLTKTIGDRKRIADLSLEEARADLAEYVATVKEALPDVSVGLVEALFRYTIGEYGVYTKSFGDLAEDILGPFLDDLEDAGTSIDGYTAEAAFDKTEGTQDGWEKLRFTEQWIREQGLEFSYIYNDAETGHNGDERRYFENTLRAQQKHRAVGGRPDQMIVQSWFPTPERILPEDERYTFMYVAREFIDRLDEPVSPGV